MKKDFVIQITRIVAMFLIIMCHLVQEFENPYVQMTSQFFNVGVFIFLFISGYLYGTKKIENPKRWLMNRFLKIMIPVYVFMLFLFGWEIGIQHDFEMKYVWIYLLDLQFVFGGVQGAQHLWFLTVIMICYLVTPILYQKKEKLLKNAKMILAMIAILAVGFAYVRPELGRTWMYLFVYVSAYVYRNKRIDRKRSKVCLSLWIIGIFAIRIMAKLVWDGTVFYDTIVVCFTQILLTYAIYWLLKEVLRKVTIEDNVVIDHLDAISYYVYITHYMFLIGPVRTMGITENGIVNAMISIGLAWGTGVLLYRISNFLFDWKKRGVWEHGKN